MKQHHKVTITAGAWCEAWRVLAGGCRVPCCCVLAEHRTTTTERVLMLLLFLLRNVPIRYESKVIYVQSVIAAPTRHYHWRLVV